MVLRITVVKYKDSLPGYNADPGKVAKRLCQLWFHTVTMTSVVEMIYPQL